MPNALAETKPEIVTIKSMALPPKCMALLKACRAKDTSRYAIQHAFAIDGTVYATDGRIAASVTPPDDGKKLDDGIYLMVGNELFQPAEFNGGRYPKASEVFLSDEDRVEKLSGSTTGVIEAVIRHRVCLDVFKFCQAIKVLCSMELSDAWFHIRNRDTAYPVMVSGQYSLLGKVQKWGIRVVMMTFTPSEKLQG